MLAIITIIEIIEIIIKITPGIFPLFTAIMIIPKIPTIKDSNEIDNPNHLRYGIIIGFKLKIYNLE